tara:strand:- start:470 stop:952 length:483 start_codon:yes stop_codon:yes gene_type:complete
MNPMIVVWPLLRYSALKGYSEIGPAGTVAFGAAMLHPVSRKVVLRLAYLSIVEGFKFSLIMTRGSAVIAMEEVLIPYATRVISAAAATTTTLEAALLNLTRFGSVGATPAAVVAGAVFFAVAFPVAMATSEGQPGGDMYTQEIIDYEESVTWGGSGGMMI